LRELIISEADIEQSPQLERARAALAERKNPDPKSDQDEADIL
jgi:hypothetical protein